MTRTSAAGAAHLAARDEFCQREIDGGLVASKGEVGARKHALVYIQHLVEQQLAHGGQAATSHVALGLVGREL